MASSRSVPAAPTRGHLFQLDLVRVLTFGAVIGVHATAAGFAGDSADGNALLLALHFTREGFFALSGFVLLYAYRDRPLRPMSFWRRRLPLVAVPYLAWSVLYELLRLRHDGTGAAAAESRFGTDLLQGTAEYHLYFLLVTLQIYLLLPVLLGLVRRTAGHHVLLLVASTVGQVALATAIQYGHATSTIGIAYFSHAYELVVTYQLWILLGALAAFHLERLQVFVDRHRVSIMAAVALIVLAAELTYRHAIGGGTAPEVASSVFQPALVPVFAAIIAGLYAFGSWWAARRGGGRLSRVVAWASQASFGIYLIHPAVLDVVVPHLPPLPPAVATVLLWLVATVVSVAFVTLVRRTPLSMPLTGRPWCRRVRAATPAAVPAVQVGV